MTTAKAGLVGVVLLIAMIFKGDAKMPRADSYPRARTIQQDAAPPLPVFVPFVSLDGRLTIREGETLIIGEMVTECLPGFSGVFVSDTSFVTLIDDSCLCTGKVRFLIRVAPQRGDAGKYHVVIRGNACNANANSLDTFDIKVKPTS
jgi:hypothetical protein